MDVIKSALKNLFTVNIGYKLLSFLIAVVLWFSIVNLEDPNQTTNFTMNVNVINDYILAAENRYYTIPGESTVTFRVTAPRSVIDKLSEADFSVIANVENLVDDKRIPIEISADRYGDSIDIVSKTQYLYVSIGDIKSTQIQITPEITGEPVEGCVIGDITVAPRDVTITGPDYLVDDIKKIVARVDMSDATADVTSNSKVCCLDEYGKEISDTTDLEGVISWAAVNVEVLTEKELPLNYITSGALGDGLFLRNITSNTDSIKVIGKANVLKDVHSIDISSEDMNLTGKSKSFSVDLDMEDYLPAGCTLDEDSPEKISVRFEIVASADRAFQIKTEKLKVTGLQSGLKVTFPKAYYEVVISGDADDLDLLTDSNIIGTVNLEDLKEGTYDVEVSVNVPDNYKVNNTVKIPVSIKKE